MEKTTLYQDIAKRTDGDIYVEIGRASCRERV